MMARHLLGLLSAAALLHAHPLLAQAGAPTTDVFVARLGERTRKVTTTAHPSGGIALRADLLAEGLGGQLVRDAARPGRYRLEVGAVGIDIEQGVALAIVAGDTVPLSAEVFRRAGSVFVPLSLAADLLPRLGTGVLFDAEKREIRRFAPVVASRRAPAPAARASTTSSTGVAAATRADTERVAERITERIAERSSTRGAETRASGRQRIVVVDAGHGGPDNGMSGPIGGGPKVFEKNITLAVSKQLRRALESRGVKVIMTRTTDTLIALSDRGRIANEAKGDLFVSIHVNAANPRWQNPGGARGYETYFLAEAKTEDERRVAAMENEAVRFETTADVNRDDPLGFIMRDMAQNEHLRESSRLAQLVQAGMREVHPGPSRGVKQAGFRVLVTAFMPAVLVEIGFGTNASEASYMTSPDKQEELAARLADAIVRYLAEYERKVSG